MREVRIYVCGLKVGLALGGMEKVPGLSVLS